MEEKEINRMTDTKYCYKCGAEIDREAEICVKCGVRQPNTSTNNTNKNEKDKLVAGLLGIILGSVGIHKFYLGKSGQGVAYLLLCWTFIPAIVGFVEGISYLCMSEEKFNSKYNQN